MATHTIFYSWQSDLPNACNRGFIQVCLEDAIRQLQTDNGLELDPSLDRDIQGTSGSADIAATLFTKIRAADVFVADISIINQDSSLKYRPTPNPNVLAELGYAAGFHGWDKVICVLNTTFGAIDKLPFDIRHRRILDYELRPGEDKQAPRKALSGMLRNALREVLVRPAIDDQTQSYIALDCPLTEDEYNFVPIRVRAHQYQRLALRIENPLEKALGDVHICFRDFQLFYMPWSQKARPKTDPIAGGYSYYWLTTRQLEDLETKPQTIRFILNGTRCGEHDLVLVWSVDGIPHQRIIKVIVEPKAG